VIWPSQARVLLDIAAEAAVPNHRSVEVTTVQCKKTAIFIPEEVYLTGELVWKIDSDQELHCHHLQDHSGPCCFIPLDQHKGSDFIDLEKHLA
jgi:hypothetical protein